MIFYCLVQFQQAFNNFEMDLRVCLRSMQARQHTSKHYEQQLRRLKEKLLLIGHQAETAIADSTRALMERRPSLAQKVIDADDQVDRLEVEIDDLCFEILALEQPVASDLRFIATAMKIVGDIERIGDIGVNIAQRCLEIVSEPEFKPVIDIPLLAVTAQRALQESLDAFVNGDAEMAKRVIQNGRYVNDLCEQMLRRLLTYMLEDPETVPQALRLTFVARKLERIGDHAVNIAEMVIFLVEGQDVRHRNANRSSPEEHGYRRSRQEWSFQ
jgi:phosphate transport system protein